MNDLSDYVLIVLNGYYKYPSTITDYFYRTLNKMEKDCVVSKSLFLVECSKAVGFLEEKLHTIIAERYNSTNTSVQKNKKENILNKKNELSFPENSLENLNKSIGLSLVAFTNYENNNLLYVDDLRRIREYLEVFKLAGESVVQENDFGVNDDGADDEYRIFRGEGHLFFESAFKMLVNLDVKELPQIEISTIFNFMNEKGMLFGNIKKVDFLGWLDDKHDISLDRIYPKSQRNNIQFENQLILLLDNLSQSK